MALTNLEMGNLANGASFQLRVKSSILKKSLAILDDVVLNGVLNAPTVGGTPNYTASQYYLAKQIANGQSIESYYQLLARATNVIAGSVITGGTDTSITDAALDSQVFTTIFIDLT